MSTIFASSPQRAASPASFAFAMHTKRASTRVDKLVVNRKEISFHNVTRDLVRIDVTVHNTGLVHSEPTPLVLESAPFGAFVSWTPLATLTVPTIAPGRKTVVSTIARAPRTVPIGDFDNITPRRLLTATGGGDMRRPNRSSARALAATPALLARDVLELMGRRTTHWAGNLNVFIGRQAVERHRARALRIYPGKQNMAMFLCGERPDAYAFHVEGSGAAWETRLFVPGEKRTLLLGCEAPIEVGSWIRTPGPTPILLSLAPPADAVHGEVEVHVEQRSTGKAAVVEFSLDANAAGPGCYVA